MNVIVLTGNVTKDPEIKKIGENKVAKFTLAVNRSRKENDHYVADFFACDAWGPQADFVERHVVKGTKLAVNGRIEFRNVEKDGVSRQFATVTVDRVEFNGRKENDGEGSATPAAQPAKAVAPAAPASEDPF